VLSFPHHGRARQATRHVQPQTDSWMTHARHPIDDPSTAARARRATPSRRQFVAKLFLVGTILAGCQPNMAGNGGDTGMFGLFKGKAAPLPSVVAPELGAQLHPETAFPAQAPALPKAAYDHCKPTRVAGTLPQARFVETDTNERSVAAWRIAPRDGVPPLALVNISGLHPHVELWELGAEAVPSFVRQRDLQIDPGQQTWGVSHALDAACVPGERLVVGMAYANPRTQHALYLYDLRGNASRKLGDAVRDSSTGLPDRLFETWPVAPDSALVLWHSGEIRVKAEVYVRERDHFMLFSPRHPQGLEVLTLGLDDGNVERWAMVGRTLWLETVDARDIAKPKTFVWSIDLTKAL
jgi:hypothetical protein